MAKLSKEKATDKAVKFMKENDMAACIITSDGQIFHATKDGENFANSLSISNKLDSWEVKATKKSKSK